MNDLQSMLKDLYMISGLNMSIFDVDGKLITSYPTKKCTFCSLIAKDKNALTHCYACDQKAFKKVKETGKIYIYQCYFHLYEACMPLYTYGTLSGYFMIGQTISNSHFDKHDLITTASQYIKDEKLLNEAINQISKHNKEQILSFASIVDICAKYLTLTNRIEAKNKNLAEEVKQYIIQNYYRDITIDELCNYFYCSKATLINRFKEIYNDTIHQYLMKYRLDKAKELLLNKNLSIQEIAISSGFKDANYFSKAFKKHMNMSPRQYREKKHV